MLGRMLFPLLLIGGGVALAVSSAKADAKKKKIDKALDLGLDDEDTDQPPLPPAMTKAYSQNPVNRETFNAWWYSTEYPGNGVMGFWLDTEAPMAITDLLPNSGYTDSVVVTIDGAFWYYEDGWHPAERLAIEYDNWFNG